MEGGGVAIQKPYVIPSPYAEQGTNLGTVRAITIEGYCFISLKLLPVSSK